MALFGNSNVAKDLRTHREQGDRLRRAGKPDEAADAYRLFMRALVEQGLKLRAIQACRMVLELKPEDIEARLTLDTLTGVTNVRDNITVEVQPADVLSEATTITMTSSPTDLRALASEGGSSTTSIPPVPVDIEDDALLHLVARMTRLFAGLPEE